MSTEAETLSEVVQPETGPQEIPSVEQSLALTRWLLGMDTTLQEPQEDFESRLSHEHASSNNFDEFEEALRADTSDRAFPKPPPFRPRWRPAEDTLMPVEQLANRAFVSLLSSAVTQPEVQAHHDLLQVLESTARQAYSALQSSLFLTRAGLQTTDTLAQPD